MFYIPISADSLAARRLRQYGPPALMVILVCAVHGALLAHVFWPRNHPPQPLNRPSIQGVLLPPAPAEQVQAPSAAAPQVQSQPQQQKTEKVQKKPITAPITSAITEHGTLAENKPETTEKPEQAVTEESEDHVSEDDSQQQEQVQQSAQPTTNTDSKKQTQGATITPPRLDALQHNNPAPAYPSVSRRMKEEGTVWLEVRILADGQVGEIRIKQSSGYDRLDKTAIKAVKRWTYVPAYQDDKAVEYWYLQPLQFSLKPS